MNLQEMVDALTELASKLPAGWDSGVRVSICNGQDNDLTRAVQVDQMTMMSMADGTVAEVFAIVQGHPHLDVKHMSGATNDADDYLRRWSEDDDS